MILVFIIRPAQALAMAVKLQEIRSPVDELADASRRHRERTLNIRLTGC